MRESMVGENNPSYKEGRRVTMSFRTTEERRAAVKELAQANRCNTSDMLNQLIDTAYDAHNQQTEAFLPASPPPRHRPTPQPAPTPSADDEPTPPPANISFDEAIEILKRNGGVRKLPRRQLWHFGKHKIRLDEDGIIEE
ncbi:MAG TPA: hypothetical protein VLL52_14980, partial [Anaerolineae bacterium]|nr:hypothetical protein [Anaerolineae bacterium]